MRNAKRTSKSLKMKIILTVTPSSVLIVSTKQRHWGLVRSYGNSVMKFALAMKMDAGLDLQDSPRQIARFSEGYSFIWLIWPHCYLLASHLDCVFESGC